MENEDSPTDTKDEQQAEEAVLAWPSAAVAELSADSGSQPTATATVKFVLVPSEQVVTKACMLNQTFLQLKTHFANQLRVPHDVLLLLHQGDTVEDTCTLADLGVVANATVQMELQSADPARHPLRLSPPTHEYQMPDVISVRMKTGDGRSQDLVVEIERQRTKKPFLGGFRNVLTGTHYHNAASQFIKRPGPGTVDKFCRDTQTVEQRHVRQQTRDDASTQMTDVGVYVNNLEEKLLAPGDYTLADDHHHMIREKVILLQKHYRRWLAQRKVAAMRRDWHRYLAELQKQKKEEEEERENRAYQELMSRMYPRTKTHFDLLYAALEKWRQAELQVIDSTMTGAERKAALNMLLDREIQLLADIDRHKLQAEVTNIQRAIQAYMAKAATPKKWRGSDGMVTAVATPSTQQAGSLHSLYCALLIEHLTTDERLDVLLSVKLTVQEHDCQLTRELVELVDREANLLMRHTKESHLCGLRKRICTLFIQFVKTPAFNPEAAHLNKVPHDTSKLRCNIFYCPSCSQYLPATAFSLSCSSRSIQRCRGCLALDNMARARLDLSLYRRMLRSLQLAEAAYSDRSQMAFLLAEGDIRYLVQHVWGGQSVLSGCQDLQDLCLVRWQSAVHWSPWNCLLLTQEEAKSHAKIDDLLQHYGEVFIDKVSYKHTLAKNHFSHLAHLAKVTSQKGSDTMSPAPSILGTSFVNRRSQTV